MEPTNIENKFDNKKIALLIVVAIVIIAIIVAVFKLLPKSAPTTEEVPTAVETVKSITKEDALTIFPKDFPIEASAPNSTVPQVSIVDNKQVISYNYSSIKSVVETTKLFQDYFKKNKWKFEMAQDTDKLKVISLIDTRTQDFIIVTISQNEDTKKAEVSVLYSHGNYKMDPAN